MQERINISLDSEIAKQLRLAAMEKYGNSRSASRLIEDMIKEYANKPDIEAMRAARTKYEADYDTAIKAMPKGKKLCGVEFYKWYKCETCDGKFQTTPMDAKHCPACGGSKIKNDPD